MVERQIVALDAVGSNPTILPFLHASRSGWHVLYLRGGVSPSGKALDFDSCTRWFESSHSWSLKAPIFFGAFLLFWQGRSADAERESKLTRLPSERERRKRAYPGRIP